MMRSVLRDGAVDMVLTGGLVGQILLIAAAVDIGAPSTDYIRAKNLWQWVDSARDFSPITERRSACRSTSPTSRAASVASSLEATCLRPSCFWTSTCDSRVV